MSNKHLIEQLRNAFKRHHLDILEDAAERLKYADDHIAELEARTPAATDVPVPLNADMAHGMVCLGMAYLKECAPERLRTPAAPVVAEGLTDEQISERVEQARLATDAHCDGLEFEPSKEYSDAYFYRYLAAHPVAGSPADTCAEMRALCSACGGTGDVHSIDGEWRGACGCEASRPAFPERDLSKPAEQQGLFRKFDVRRTDDSDQPGGKHYGCRYYVLDLTHDQHAPAAMRAYAASCATTHPQLAADIVAEFGEPMPASEAPPVPRTYQQTGKERASIEAYGQASIAAYLSTRTAAPSAVPVEAMDAARYRWLRDKHDSGDEQWFVYGANGNLDGAIYAHLAAPAAPTDAKADASTECLKCEGRGSYVTLDDSRQAVDTRCSLCGRTGRWAHGTIAAAKVDKLLTIIAYAYQVAGAHDAPDHILDVLADPEAATDEQVDAMLPYQPDTAQSVRDAAQPIAPGKDKP